jgi:cellulose synthase/poly-beta-1,6-N-acetylglucosamine synthase-like glycosyltransferase
MANLAILVLGVCLSLGVYAYIAYPLILKVLRSVKRCSGPPAIPPYWPTISITLPAFNEEDTIADTLKTILQIDYPPSERQILVVSDGSTDRTDEIVASFSDCGVELLSLPERRGKTAAENIARSHLRGEIIINTDASGRIDAQAVKRLVTALSDESVGVASCRDVSIAIEGECSNLGESSYVGYEMWVRDLETAIYGIIGASGCLYAIRSFLHDFDLPPMLSRDFAAALVAREHGYRAVSVTNAICYVPRVRSLRAEYRRKVRTIARGLRTLFYKRSLLNPFRYGLFSWFLLSHKLCRWLVPWALVVSIGALVGLSVSKEWARALLALAIVGLLVAAMSGALPAARKRSRLMEMAAFALAGNAAVLHAWIRTLRGKADAIWEPTRRVARK